MVKRKKKTKKTPQRTCVGCRVKKPKKELVRIVRTPENSIEIDTKGKMPGRGAYVCPDTQCLQQAVKNKGLNRDLSIEVDDDLLVDISSRVMEKEKKKQS